MRKSPKLESIINRCALLLDGSVISEERISKELWAFLCNRETIDDHHVDFILHTGSPIYDALVLFFYTFKALCENSLDPKTVVHSLEKGDLIVYTDKFKTRQRYVFDHIEKLIFKGRYQEYAILTQIDKKNHNIGKIPETLWMNITPYYGESTSLDGKGLRKKNSIRTQFFDYVFDMDEPNAIDTSVVFVTRKQYYLRLFDGCSIAFDNKSISLAELVHASFFTDNNEERHGGNAVGADAVLKFTSSAEFARKQFLRRSTGNCIGAVVLGDKTVRDNIGDLPDIMNRDRVPFFTVSARIDSDADQSLSELSETPIAYFACTKRNIANYSEFPQRTNPLTSALMKELSNVSHHSVERVTVGDLFKPDMYPKVIRRLKEIKTNEFTSSAKEDFIIGAYGLINLLKSAPFCMREYEEIISKNRVNAKSPSEIIQELQRLSFLLPNSLKEQCGDVIQILDETYNSIYENNSKETKLREILSQYQSKRVCLVVRKGYYDLILNETKIKNLINGFGSLMVVTPNKFNPNQMFDVIVSLSDLDGTSFNPHECISAPIIKTLLYSCEVPFYKSKHLSVLKKYSAYSTDGIHPDTEETYKYESEWLDEYKDIDASVVKEIASADSDLSEYINLLNQNIDYHRYLKGFSAGSRTAETVASALFDDGQRAFFTKMYKPYVLDEENSTIAEVPVNALKAGDTLLFIRSNEKSRDLIDEILGKMIQEKKLDDHIKSLYEKSKVWKEELLDIKERNDWSTKALYQRLVNCGISIGEVAVRSWLDEDAHIVGPADPENLMVIGTLTKNYDLKTNYMDYYDACRKIRSLRGRIMDFIGKAIVMSVTGRQPEEGSDYEKIIEDVEEMGEILEIEKIEMVQNEVPLNIINRPLSVKE